MPRFDINQLAELEPAELDARLAECRSRINTRFTLAHDQCRDLSPDEAGQTAIDRDELTALAAAKALRAGNDERSEVIGRALAEARSAGWRGDDGGPLAEFAAGLAAGVPTRAAVECRSVTSATAGARGAVAAEALGQADWLWQVASIPFTPADSLTVAGPRYAALVAQDATPEEADKPAMADPAKVSATLEAFGVTQVVSDQVIRFGIGATAVSARLASEVVFSVNAATAAALETAAGTPLGFAGSPSYSADLGIATIWAQTGAKPTLLLVNPADYPELSDKAAVGPGDTIGAEVVRFNGVPLAVNAAVTAGVGVVLNGRAFSAHGTDVLFASLPNLGDNTVTLRAEAYFALLQHDAGAAVAVDLLGS
ncbi:hypothetical protein [Mycobacterium lehmannii]|uniref:hypothetical protein n=1 Tax=Mycobacterium lehmannii TaxID=2048550 RepID=UPI000B93EFCD|nr:hypothetical protein [Mycobacterium lehmannii]